MKKRKIQILVVSLLIAIALIAFGVYWINREFEVVFVNSDNSIIERKTVKYGNSINDIETPIVPEGNKFVCWDKSLLNIKKDTLIKAVVERINNGINVISLGNSYGKSKSVVSVPLIIDGDVDICALELNVIFDPNVLTFIESTNEDSGAITNITDKGIYVSFMSTNNVETTIYMCDLVFEINENLSDSTSITIEVNKCGKIDEDKIIETKSSTIDGTIYRIS